MYQNTKVGIVGLGTMGKGLLRLFIRNKFNLIVYSRNKESLDSLASTYFSQVKEGSLVISDDLNVVAKASIVIEAITENFDAKKKLLADFSNIVTPDCIICTNTSSLSVQELALYIKNPTRFLGLHFFNPPILIKCAEIILHSEVSQETVFSISKIIESIDFKYSIINDTPGFLVNRLLFSIIVQAIGYYEQNTISPEFIDTMIETACNFKMGPLRTADLIGLDTCLTILKNLEIRGLGGAYSPPKLLEEFVSKGYLGKKTGRGFYQYG